MNKIFCFFLILCQLVLNANSLYATTSPIEMQIIALKGNNLASNKGSQDGVIVETEYQIVRRTGNNEEILGTAKVSKVISDKSGLKITTLRKGRNVAKGDWLIELTQTADDLLIILDEPNSSNEYEQKVEELENKLAEKEKKSSHTSGIITGIAICCGIVLLLNIGAAAGSE